MVGRRSAASAVVGAVLGSLLLHGADPGTAPPRPSRVLDAAAAPAAPVVARVAAPVQHVTTQVVTRTREPGRTVVLTFDDGPDPRWTPQVLALLEQAGAPAVFCMVGQQVQRFPAVARAVARRGHQLCDHTHTHDLALRHRPAARVDLEVARTAELVRHATGRVPQWFRAPGGRFSGMVDVVAQRRGLQPLSWSADPRDWTSPGSATIVRRVLAQVRPGSVVLLHDGGGDRAQTVAALRVLLRALPARGYRFVLPSPPG